MSLPIALGAIVGALVLLVTGVYWAGSQLPATRSAKASVAIHSPPENIMAVLRDVASQPAWRPDVLSVEIHSTDDWTEQRRGGESIRFRTVARTEQAIELSFVSTRSYFGHWRGQLSGDPKGGLTLLEVEESATVQSPVQRVLARIFFDPEKFSADYLSRLKTEVQRRSNATPHRQGEVERSNGASGIDAKRSQS